MPVFSTSLMSIRPVYKILDKTKNDSTILKVKKIYLFEQKFNTLGVAFPDRR